MLEKVKNRLENNGLFVLQSCCGGVDLLCNQRYVKQLAKQLKKAGAVVLHVYYLQNSPGVSLWFATKSDLTGARRKIHELESRLASDRFHA